MKVRHWLAKSQLLFTCAALTLSCGGGGIMAEPTDGDQGNGSGSSSGNDSDSSTSSSSDANDGAASTNAGSSSNSTDGGDMGSTANNTTDTGNATGTGSDNTTTTGDDDSTMADNSDNSSTGTDPDTIDDGDTTTTDTDPDVSATTDPAVPSIIDPDYPGVDVALVPAQAPAGCAGGLDLETGTLELTLDEDVRGVLLTQNSGALIVNGQPCTTADGIEASADNLAHLSIIGSEDHNFVIFDFMPSDWGNLLEQPGSVHLELDSGRNQLVFRGTAEDDSLYLGTVGADTGLDWTGDGHANVIAVDVDNIIVSLGPGNDNLGSMLDLEPTPLADEEEEPLVVDRLEVRVSAWGGDGNDDLAGGYGNDWFDGGAGDDILSGYDGTDSFADGTDLEGADVINGGAGFDEISYETRSADLNITLCRTETERGCDETCSCEADDGEVGEGDNLINLEMVIGGTGNDVMLGTESDESFYGNEGNDLLVGNTGSDLLFGQQGNDDIDGGLDEDICDDDPADIQTIGCEI